MRKKRIVSVLLAAAVVLSAFAGTGVSVQAGFLDSVKDLFAGEGFRGANGKEYAGEDRPASMIKDKAAAAVEEYLRGEGLAYEYVHVGMMSGPDSRELTETEEDNGYIIEAGDELTTDYVGYKIDSGDYGAYVVVSVSWKRGRGELNRIRLYTNRLTQEQYQEICGAVFSDQVIQEIEESVAACREDGTVIYECERTGNMPIMMEDSFVANDCFANDTDIGSSSSFSLRYYGNVMLKEVDGAGSVSQMDYTVLEGELEKEGDLFYYLSDEGAVALLYNGYGESEYMIVPEELGSEPVIRVICDEFLGGRNKSYTGENGGYYMGSYSYILIPATAKEVGCINAIFLLRSGLVLPESVEKVNKSLFHSSRLAHILCFGRETEAWETSKQDFYSSKDVSFGRADVILYPDSMLNRYFGDEETLGSFTMQYMDDFLGEMDEGYRAALMDASTGNYALLEEVIQEEMNR